MNIQRDAVRYSEPWREAFRHYMTTLMENYQMGDFNAGTAAALADVEFGIQEDQKEEAP